MSEFKTPDVRPVIRNGESVVELVQDGEVIGTLNFTKIMANLFDAFGIIKKPRYLTVVR